MPQRSAATQHPILCSRMRYSTRSATLYVGRQCAGDAYFNDSGISHSFDYFETGCGQGSGYMDIAGKRFTRIEI